MRNLKKVLALALVFAMAFTFMAGAASDFSDKAEIGSKYVDDVNMLVELGVIAGYPDGTYKPKANITRAEFAKMAYTLKYGSDKDGDLFAKQTSIFTDVQGNANVAWAKGYINYCASQGIVSGIGNNKYGPQDNITVAQATKMILVIMGCDAAKEGFIGTNWQANVVAKAIDLGVFDGWTGDPTSLATRELVAKLMKNAIFAPVYEYSAITGAGSQKNALGTEDNQTLGEKTMGLKNVTGIVVANERYFIRTDEDGDDISSLVRGTAKEDESLIYYEEKRSNGSIEQNLLTVDRALDDELLGNKVNVFFKADEASDGSYKNVEVIGNVLVNNDTVAYTVSAYNAKFMPDGETNSTTEITPYIELTVDGQKKEIKADSTVGKVAKKVNAKNVAEVKNYFNSFTYVSNETKTGAASLYLGLAEEGSLDAVGENTLDTYRFVSVDGGKTYSYIFKMVSEKNPITTTPMNASYGTVTNYNEAKKTIRVSGLSGTYEIGEDAEIIGTVATDDNVVYWRESGKLYVEKVSEITGAVEGFNDNGDAVIGGKEYYTWEDCELDNKSIFDYYQSNKSSFGSATKYYVYKNMIMEVELTDNASALNDYGLILHSSYDELMQVAQVTIVTPANKEVQYDVGKLYTIGGKDDPRSNSKEDFANNNYCGAIVKYSVMSDGKIDLSAQNLKGADFNKYYKYSNQPLDVSTKTDEFKFDGEASRFAYDNSSVVFLIYGNPCYEGGKPNYKATGQSDLKAKAYKLSEVREMNAAPIEKLCIGNVVEDDYTIASVVYNTKTGTNKYVVAAAMSIGSKLDNSNFKTTDGLAYVVSAYQNYDNKTGEYYADFTLINEEGLFTARTVADVRDNHGSTALRDDYVGSLSNGKAMYGDMFRTGSFVRYELNADKKISVLDNADLSKDDVSLSYNGESNGIFLINVLNIRKNVVTFYDTSANIANSDDPAAIEKSCKFDDKEYHIIGISDGTYTGEDVIKLPNKFENLEIGKGNAIIEVQEGEIVRLFSFDDDWEK